MRAALPDPRRSRRRSAHVDFDLPGGGLALWLKLGGDIDIDRLAADALEEGVRILPGSQFADRPGPVPAFRLGYGSLDSTELGRGLARLRSALQRQTGPL